MPPRPKRYHHANLKQRLVDSALALMAEVGPRAFTLREVARRARVSHNAPYRHFQDKDALLAAVAAQGFDQLTGTIVESMAAGKNAEDRLRLAGRGYVRFALEQPQHLLVMFEAPLHDSPRPEYESSSRRAFETLLEAIAAVQAQGGLPAGDPHPCALAAWSAVHGLSKLAIAGRLPFDNTQTIAFSDYLTAALSEGMANLPHPGDIPDPKGPAPGRSTRPAAPARTGRPRRRA